MTDEINIFRVLDYIRDNASKYAQAKANRAYLEEFRKSKKAILFSQAPQGTVVDREAYAYSHPEYLELLDGLKVAVEMEAYMKTMLDAAHLKAEAWRTLESNKRAEGRITQ